MVGSTNNLALNEHLRFSHMRTMPSSFVTLSSGQRHAEHSRSPTIARNSQCRGLTMRCSELACASRPVLSSAFPSPPSPAHGPRRAGESLSLGSLAVARAYSHQLI